MLRRYIDFFARCCTGTNPTLNALRNLVVPLPSTISVQDVEEELARVPFKGRLPRAPFPWTLPEWIIKHWDQLHAAYIHRTITKGDIFIVEEEFEGFESTAGYTDLQSHAVTFPRNVNLQVHPAAFTFVYSTDTGARLALLGFDISYSYVVGGQNVAAGVRPEEFRIAIAVSPYSAYPSTPGPNEYYPTWTANALPAIQYSRYTTQMTSWAMCHYRQAPGATTPPNFLWLYDRHFYQEFGGGGSSTPSEDQRNHFHDRVFIPFVIQDKSGRHDLSWQKPFLTVFVYHVNEQASFQTIPAQLTIEIRGRYAVHRPTNMFEVDDLYDLRI